MDISEARAFSGQVDTGWPKENVTKLTARAFSGQVDAGWRKDNATKQKDKAVNPIHSDQKPPQGPEGRNEKIVQIFYGFLVRLNGIKL